MTQHNERELRHMLLLACPECSARITRYWIANFVIIHIYAENALIFSQSCIRRRKKETLFYGRTDLSSWVGRSGVFFLFFFLFFFLEAKITLKFHQNLKKLKKSKKILQTYFLKMFSQN